MDAANRMISGMVDAATNPSRAAGVAQQSGALTGTREDAQRMYAALQPFQALFPASGTSARAYSSRPLPWSSGSMPAATPQDLASLLGRMKGMFPGGVSGSTQSPTGFSGSAAAAQLQALYNSAQQNLQSGDPNVQLQGQDMLQQYQNLISLFSTLLSIQASTQKMLIENLRTS